MGLIGSLIGNGIVFFFFAFTSSKYGTLADWVSGIGTVAAIFFVYWQIDEQKREFKEETSSKVSISFSKQFTMENVEIGKIPGEPKYYIWAVNTGLSSGSFIFLGFCRKEDFKYIRDEEKDVVYNPDHGMLHDFKPYTRDDFQPLKPGEISKQEIVPEKLIDEYLNHPKDFYVLYMSATGKIDKREIKINEK